MSPGAPAKTDDGNARATAGASGRRLPSLKPPSYWNQPPVK